MVLAPMDYLDAEYDVHVNPGPPGCGEPREAVSSTMEPQPEHLVNRRREKVVYPTVLILCGIFSDSSVPTILMQGGVEKELGDDFCFCRETRQLNSY